MGEGVFQDVIKYTMRTNKLQGITNHLERLYKNEKVATKSKHIMIVELENQIPKLVKDPSHKKPMQNLLKDKDKGISSLKRT